MGGDQAAEGPRGEVREYILDMLLQLAVLAEQCRDIALAEILKKAAATASAKPAASG